MVTYYSIPINALNFCSDKCLIARLYASLLFDYVGGLCSLSCIMISSRTNFHKQETFKKS